MATLTFQQAGDVRGGWGEPAAARARFRRDGQAGRVRRHDATDRRGVYRKPVSVNRTGLGVAAVRDIPFGRRQGGIGKCRARQTHLRVAFRGNRPARYRSGRGESRAALGRCEARPCRDGGHRIGPAPNRIPCAGRRGGEGEGRLVAACAGATDWRASFGPRPAGRICRSSAIRPCQRIRRTHAGCASGSGRPGGALGRTPCAMPRKSGC